MLFACLTAPTTGGATAIADAPTVLEALPTELVHRFEQEGWLLTRTYNDEIGALTPKPSAPTTGPPSRSTAAPTPSNWPGNPTAVCVPVSAAPP